MHKIQTGVNEETSHQYMHDKKTKLSNNVDGSDLNNLAVTSISLAALSSLTLSHSCNRST